jgi:UDP-N-acetylglucosamine/UDP-N-acetylgalactosamine diphosphorylase
VERVAETLEAHGQEHLLAGLGELTPDMQRRFLERLDEVDWEELERPAEPPAADDVRPAAVVTLDERARRHDELAAAGEDAYRRGAVGVLVVAGGQGTRLGFDGPKGVFPIGVHSGKSIYQLQAEKVLSLSRRVGRAVPLLVLTSPMTDAETRDFFAAHGDFGLAPGQVVFFTQGTVPSLDRSGRALLAGPGVLLENPDGHGGVFTALVDGGELERLREQGVEQLVYIQVDNVLAPVDDPVLVGLAVVENADVVTKVLEKTHPDERVGHLVTDGARDRVIEYTELTPEQTRARTADGELIYRWGSPAMHAWSVDFLSRLAGRGYRLPLHRSAKPLRAWIDGEQRTVEGWKFERFVFDLIPEAERSVGLEIERAVEFAPLKNAEGEDSPETAVALAHRNYVDWLEAAGVSVDLPPGELIEISPLLAATREQFLALWDGRVTLLKRGTYLDEVVQLD